jgi:nucleotide-binding universal stress UspA family protein
VSTGCRPRRSCGARSPSWADGVEVEIDAVIGDPAEVLVDLSRHIDLLVCGSRGYGPVRGVLLGSVSRRIVREVHRPVTVLPRGVRAPWRSC